MQHNNIKTLCFIDDFIEGDVDGIPIISYVEFIEKHQVYCDCVVKGPLQKGEIEGRDGLLIKVINMEWTWFA